MAIGCRHVGLYVVNSTLSANITADGGGVFSESGDVSLLHTTVTLNSDSVAGSSISAKSGDVGDVSDPKLGALAANGGPTLTHSPKNGSEAGDFGDDGDRAGNGGEGGMTPAAPAAPVEAEPTFTG